MKKRRAKKKRANKNISDIVKSTIIDITLKKNHKRKARKNNIQNLLFKQCIRTIDLDLSRKLAKLSIENSIEDAKNEDKNSDDAFELFDVKDEDELDVQGGYGIVSKSIGYAPKSNYVNYDRIWGHVGQFKSHGMYEDNDGAFNSLSNSETSRGMVETEVIEKAAKHFKYFVRGDVIGDFGYVPPVGMGIHSKDWEKYRLMSMMSVYRPLLALKRASA